MTGALYCYNFQLGATMLYHVKHKVSVTASYNNDITSGRSNKNIKLMNRIIGGKKCFLTREKQKSIEKKYKYAEREGLFKKKFNQKAIEMKYRYNKAA